MQAYEMYILAETSITKVNIHLQVHSTIQKFQN